MPSETANAGNKSKVKLSATYVRRGKQVSALCILRLSKMSRREEEEEELDLDPLPSCLTYDIVRTANAQRRSQYRQYNNERRVRPFLTN